MDIGSKELCIRLSEILDRVGREKRIRIVRRGKLAAEPRPIDVRTFGAPSDRSSYPLFA